MKSGKIPNAHLQLIQRLCSAEIERLYLQSWIINVRDTNLRNDPDFKNLFKRSFRKK